MKRIIVTIAALILMASNLYSQVKGVIFLENLSWAQVKEKAKMENKYIFLDVYATWCAPCKMMDQKVYPNISLGRAVNDKFISVKVQQDRTKNDNEHVKSWYVHAKAINEQYQITSLPSFLFFSPDGKLIHRSTGYQDTLLFRQTLDLALANPIRKLESQLAEYKKGKNDRQFLHDLAILAESENDEVNAINVASAYIKRMQNPFTKDNLTFIFRFTKAFSNPGYAILSNSKEKVNQIMGANAAENKIMNIIYKEEITQYEQSNKPDWGTIENLIASKYGVLGLEKLWGVMVLYYLNKKDWTNFGKYYKQYFDTAIGKNRSFLHMNNMSWPIVENVSDKGVLETAIKTMAYTIEKYDLDNPYSIDTYANLLYKAGRTSDAIVQEEKAVRLSKGNKEMVETLRKMQKGEKIW